MSRFKATDSNKLSLSHGGLFADKIDRQGTVNTGTHFSLVPRLSSSFCVQEKRVWVRSSAHLVNYFTDVASLL